MEHRTAARARIAAALLTLVGENRVVDQIPAAILLRDLERATATGDDVVVMMFPSWWCPLHGDDDATLRRAVDCNCPLLLEVTRADVELLLAQRADDDRYRHTHFGEDVDRQLQAWWAQHSMTK